MASVKKKTATRTKSTKSTAKSKVNKSKSVRAKKSTKTLEASSGLSLKERVTNQRFYDQLKLSESYISLILGGLVVAGVSAIFFVFIRESRRTITPPPQPEVIKAVSPALTKTPQQTYIMQENESLWDVAVREYGDGFRYTEIIEANPDIITNPDYVPPGTKIVIPQAK
jgi:nucleoid-associated protein YgaU